MTAVGATVPGLRNSSVDLLEECPEASSIMNRPVFLWREDRYWAESRGMLYWNSMWTRDDIGAIRRVAPIYGGSKIRMLDHVRWGRGPVFTTGIVQSNQVRQVAAYMAEGGFQSPLEVMVMPDAGEVDPETELNRGNLLMARELYPRCRITVLPDASEASRARLDDWLSHASLHRHGTLLPRGMACQAGVDGTREIGQAIDLAVREKRIPENPTVLLVSGSGSTHIGIAEGMARTPGATVIGLSTKPDGDAQLLRLRARAPALERLYVDDVFGVVGGGSTPESDRSVDRWSGILGVEMDRFYCGRLCQWLDARRDAAARGERTYSVVTCDGVGTTRVFMDETVTREGPVVLIVTGRDKIG
jgi:hypothetical protein